MKKRLLTFLLIFVVSFALAGCAALKDNVYFSDAPVPTPAQVESTFSDNDKEKSEQTVLTRQTMPDGLELVLYSDGKLCVSGADVSNNLKTGNVAKNYGAKVVSIEFGEGVTKIADQAFSGLFTLQAIYMGPDLKEIGAYAFSNCTGITEINFGENLEIIGDYAFDGCESLKNAILGDHLKKIGYSIFNGCTNLTTLRINSNISSHAFRDLEALQSVSCGENVTVIGSYAFYGCPKLKTLSWPSVETIEEFAFYGCESMVDLNLDKSVKTIGTSAFSGCENLLRIYIPANVDTVGSYCFANDINLTSVILEKSNAEEGEDRQRTLGNSVFSGCEALKEVNIAEGYTSIGDYAFADCENLYSLVIPHSMKKIGYGFISNDENLKSLEYHGNGYDWGKIRTTMNGTFKDAEIYGPTYYVTDWKKLE